MSGIAIYFIIWWMTLFLVLPWGATSAHEAGEDVIEGTAKAAPLKPRIALKFLITTILAAIIFAALDFVFTSGMIKLDDIPFFPKFENATSS